VLVLVSPVHHESETYEAASGIDLSGEHDADDGGSLDQEQLNRSHRGQFVVRREPPRFATRFIAVAGSWSRLFVHVFPSLLVVP